MKITGFLQPERTRTSCRVSHETVARGTLMKIKVPVIDAQFFSVEINEEKKKFRIQNNYTAIQAYSTNLCITFIWLRLIENKSSSRMLNNSECKKKFIFFFRCLVCCLNLSKMVEL